MGEAATIILVRHGETSANTGGIWHGSTDTPLSERGHRQADRVAEYLASRADPPAAIYASPLQRAHDTARAIARRIALEVEIEAKLEEYHLGRWEGISYKDLHEKHDFWSQIKSDPHFAPHGGESPIQVVERYIGALERIADQHRGERVIVVGHGGAMCMALAHLLDGDYSNWSAVMANCAVTELVLEPAPELLSFNYKDHLEDV